MVASMKRNLVLICFLVILFVNAQNVSSVPYVGSTKTSIVTTNSTLIQQNTPEKSSVNLIEAIVFILVVLAALILYFKLSAKNNKKLVRVKGRK